MLDPLKPLNFDFLEKDYPRLAELGHEAENLLYQKMHESSMRTLRNFAERVARIVAKKNGIKNMIS